MGGVRAAYRDTNPRDKLGLSLGQAGLALCKIRRKPGLVPGTKWVCPRDKFILSPGHSRGRPKGSQTKRFMFMCLFLA